MRPGGSPQRWAVIGGGMLGLTLAKRFRAAGHRVTLFEAAPELGGLASAWQLGDVVWDRHYHVTLLSDSFTRGILREIDLEQEMDWVVTRAGFHANGRLSPLSNSVDFLRLPALGIIGKLRLAATITWASRVTDWKSLESVRVEDWLTRLSGRRVFQELWRPLLRAKLGEAWRESSAAFIWATIQRLNAARNSGLKREMFGYVRGGYSRIMAHFARSLQDAGVELRLAAPVRRVVRTDAGVRIELEGAGPEDFDVVALTAPMPVASRLCPELSEDEQRRLRAVRYQGVVCASLLLEKPLAGYYLTYLLDDWVPFTAIVEMTAMVDPRLLGGRTLVYLPKYVASDDPLFDLPDEELQESFLTALERLHPRFRRSELLCWRVSRARNVFPIPTLGYSESLPPMQTSVPGLWLVNSAHIVNGTLNVNDTVALAERAAARMLATSQG